jgi:transposase
LAPSLAPRFRPRTPEVVEVDVHKKTVTACVRLPGPRGDREQHVRTFGTTAAELLALRDWLGAYGVTHVARVSTGVYWKPIFYVLEEALTCVLANAAQIAQVPGRKTDVKDCAWIAQLLEHGLVRGSFVPPAPIRELRDLTRYRKALIQERTREANRLHKILEDAGIKLASVASDVLGVSGRAMLEALVGGTTNPEVLADLARGALRKKLPALRHALAGRFRAHHAFLIAQLLAHLDYLEEMVETLSVQIEVVIAPFAEEVARLDTIHGVNRRTAEVIIAEIGADMSVFPSAGHPASWAGLCPGNNESAGKHRPGTTRKGNKWQRGAAPKRRPPRAASPPGPGLPAAPPKSLSTRDRPGSPNHPGRGQSDPERTPVCPPIRRPGDGGTGRYSAERDATLRKGCFAAPTFRLCRLLRKPPADGGLPQAAGSSVTRYPCRSSIWIAR